jgi:menaquinone-dependent protoporphyrinogen oxidase
LEQDVRIVGGVPGGERSGQTMAERVLVAYATKMGSNTEVAHAIAEVLQAAGLDADAVPAREVRDLSPYGAVVLGSALYAAHWQREANRFLNRHREGLKARRVWLYSSGPLDHHHAAQNLPITTHAAEAVGDIPYVAHRTFGGRLDPAAPGIDAQILATHPIGDFRNWPAIRAWAGEIAATLLADG